MKFLKGVLSKVKPQLTVDRAMDVLLPELATLERALEAHQKSGESLMAEREQLLDRLEQVEAELAHQAVEANRARTALNKLHEVLSV